MIARIWHGRTDTAKADAYLDILQRTGIPDYKATPGNLGAYILRREEGDVTHFITFTFWESMDAIKAFAGEDVEMAKYYPEDQDYLLEFEPTVTHYEVYQAAE
ncbi:MAG TPA: antibiotic biosynthesis monooxygenase [Oceanobacillus sp.]|nr:antibiotic biosynthesis monooxygenase [Oceanobacillus sp.]